MLKKISKFDNKTTHMECIKSLIILFSLALIGCSEVSESDLILVETPTETISYNEHVKPIIDNNCINCHSNPAINGASLPFSNYSELKFAVENTDLIDRMNRNPGDPGFMPLGGVKLPQNLINIVINWEIDGFEE
jgi:hypothetical protein